MLRRLFAIGLGMLAPLSRVSLAAAAVVAAPRAAVAVPPATASGPVHRLFGTLLNVAGETFTLQLRDGRLLQVNATQAFALARVSEPLFRGKPVVVDGTLGGGVFYATTVKRGVPQRSNWGVDR